MKMRTTDQWRNRNKASASDDLNARVRLIMHRNPGHDEAAARQAALDEAVAIRAVAQGDKATLPEARLHLRAMQLRAANLDLTEEAAQKLAHVQIAGEV